MTTPNRDLPALPSHMELIRQSHGRSAALGLSRGERLAFGPMMRSDLAGARDRNQRLCMHAAPVMQALFEQIAGTESMIVLTDAHGTILHSVGDDDFLARATKVALAPGENWAEHAKGTNAIGTALFEEKPILVHAHEHYIRANSFLTCSAAPIFDPRGQVLGVLDVTGDHRGYHQHTMGLVRMSARMIENHSLCDDHRQHLRLHFHSRPECIGTLLEGIVAVAPDGQIVGANRSALDQLGLSAGALRAQSLTSLLGISAAVLHDHFRTPLAAPLRLSLPTGQPLCVSARLEGPAQAAGGRPPPTAAAEPPPAAIAESAAAAHGSGLQALCTGDPQIELLVGKLRRVIDRDIALLILGETGTGKEAVARAIHQDSARAALPFVAVHGAGLLEAQFEAELFGLADGGGTLFLDEIGDLPLALQGRLLRVLQARSVAPLGGARAGSAGFAVIGASQGNLRERIHRHEFREDLYHHLNGLTLRLPPLRERSDLDAVAHRILLAQGLADPPSISPPVMALFRHCRWPGNIRQLVNLLRTATVVAGGARWITTNHLSDDFLEEMASPAPAALTPHDASGTPAPARRPARTLDEAQTDLIRSTLQSLGGNISAASKQLGISRNTIYRKLRWNAAAGGP